MAGLLLAPAVVLCLAEFGDVALGAIREDAVAATIVGADGLVGRLGVTVAVDGQAERQARGDEGGASRDADAEARDREDVVGQAEEASSRSGERAIR